MIIWASAQIKTRGVFLKTNYVMHYCRNKNRSASRAGLIDTARTGTGSAHCNNGWIDKDLTNVKTYPLAWKYCRECAERIGIEFEKQKPGDYRSEEEKEITNLKLQKSIQAKRLKQCF